ncbi:hypothetical protein [Parasitella parasitica]|uniref:Uncharacterized protein n=1 Tax=Parasitella parasitica TaxID=35722 RepID=A0A0B7N9D5_9FUNG|nr:hypothetical protein [Parasitella parasitica]
MLLQEQKVQKVYISASSASIDALSFGVDASTFGSYLVDDNAANPIHGDANEAADIFNDIDINDSIDYLSNQKMKKKAFVAHEAWNSYRDVLSKLYFKATIAGPKSCVKITIGSGCASDELCSAECVPYLTHKAVRVFFQHGIAYFRYVQNKIC